MRRRAAFRAAPESLEGRALLAFALGWGQGYGGGGTDWEPRVALDPSGAYYYLAGYTEAGISDGGLNLDPAGSPSGVVSGQTRGVLAKYRTDGSLVWAEDIGSTSSADGAEVQIKGICVSPSGDVYLAGEMTTFDAGSLTLGQDVYTTGSSARALAVKYDANGGLGWSRAMGTAGADCDGYGIAYHGATASSPESVYLTGEFRGAPGQGSGVTSVPLGVSSRGQADAFAWKLDAATGDSLWFKALGGTGNERGNAIAADGSGNVYLTGYFAGTADFDPGAGAYNLTSTAARGGSASADAFVAKLSPDGNFAWAGQMGGADYDEGRAIAIDPGGNVVVAGTFSSATNDFDPGSNKLALKNNGGSDAFVAKLDATRKLLWAGSLGGTGTDRADAVAADGAGNVYTTGNFSGTADFDPGKAAVNLAASAVGGDGAFVSKLGPGGQYLDAGAIRSVGTDQGVTPGARGASLAVGGDGSVYTAGAYRGVIDLDPGAGTSSLTSRPISATDPYAGGQPSYDLLVTRWKPGTVSALATASRSKPSPSHLPAASHLPRGPLHEAARGRGHLRQHARATAPSRFAAGHVEVTAGARRVGHPAAPRPSVGTAGATVRTLSTAPLSFGPAGTVTTAVGSSSRAQDVVLYRQDGLDKVVAVGHYADTGGVSHTALVRYMPDGTLDGTFGSGGIVKSTFSAAGDQALAAAVQADGKIVVVGAATLTKGIAQYSAYLVARYNPNGTLDKTFNGTGSVIAYFDNQKGDVGDVARAVALQTVNGTTKIVVAGTSSTSMAVPRKVAAARYNLDGTLDTSFGAGGRTLTSYPGASNQDAYAMALQANGKIVVAGSTWLSGVAYVGLTRYDAAGRLDPTFGGTGQILLGTMQAIDKLGVAIQPVDGKIVVGGAKEIPLGGDAWRTDFAASRWNPDGTLDTTFGTGGTAKPWPSSVPEGTASDVAIQADGKIVLGGYLGGPQGFQVVRLGADGSLDTGFDGDGAAQVPIGYFDSAMALLADGRIVQAGFAPDPASGKDAFALARYNPDGSLDTTF